MTTSTTQANFIDFTSGPPSGDIWNAAEYRYAEHRPSVTFSGIWYRGGLKMTVSLEMRIVGVMHDDGSGHELIVWANVINRQESEFLGKLKLYFNTKFRSGRLDLNQK